MSPKQPIPIPKVREQVPWWPFSSWSTYDLVKSGALGSIKVGHRKYVTLELLQKFLDARTVDGSAT